MYQQLEPLLGDELDRIFDGFIACHPLKSSNLDCFEAVFIEHLAQLKPKYVDVAKADYALYQSYYAADAKAFQFAAFSALSTKQLDHTTFNLAPWFRWVESKQPLDEIWHAFKSGNTEAMEVLLRRKAKCSQVFFSVRPDFQPQLIKASSQDIALLNAINLNIPLANMGDWQAVLPAWIEKRMVDQFQVLH